MKRLRLSRGILGLNVPWVRGSTLFPRWLGSSLWNTAWKDLTALYLGPEEKE